MDERIENVVKHPAFIPSVVGVASFGVGVGVGYFLGRREKKFQTFEPALLNMDLDQDDLEELREMHLVDDEDVHPSIDATIDAKDFIAKKLQDTMMSHEDISEIQELEEHNIFAQSDDEWDHEKEIKSRLTSEPYILHKDEFFAQERPDYSQLTLTYFVGDDVLVDQDEKPIYPFQNVTGPLTFGHGSGDPNVVYIRNEKLKAEYEVIKMNAMYAVEVLGLEAEETGAARDIAHSSVPRFRPTD